MSNPLMKYKPPPDKIPIHIRLNYLKYLRTINNTRLKNIIHTRIKIPNQLKIFNYLTNEEQPITNKRMRYHYFNTCTSSQCTLASPPSGAPPVGHISGRVVLSHNKDLKLKPLGVNLKGPLELRAVALISCVPLSQDKDLLVETLGSPLRGLSAVALIPSGVALSCNKDLCFGSIRVYYVSECCRTARIIFLSICVYLASIVLVTHECYCWVLIRCFKKNKIKI